MQHFGQVHWQEPVMSLLTGLYIRMYVACPLQNLVGDFGLAAALCPRMLGCVRQGLLELDLVWCQRMAGPVTLNTDLG